MQKCGLRHPCYVVEGEVTRSGMQDHHVKAIRTAVAESMVDGFTVRLT